MTVLVLIVYRMIFIIKKGIQIPLTKTAVDLYNEANDVLLKHLPEIQYLMWANSFLNGKNIVVDSPLSGCGDLAFFLTNLNFNELHLKNSIEV
jgi:hypothetical protein